jgi:hypothetical protein
MEQDNLSLEEFNKLYGESFCVKPFIEMCNDTANNVLLCCNSEIVVPANERYGNTHRDIFFNHTKFNEIRMDMLHNQTKTIDACVKCVSSEPVTGTSMRLESSNQVLKGNPSLFNSIVQDGVVELKSLDIKFGNTCNMGCVMCSASSSSVISQERHDNPTPALLKDIWLTPATALIEFAADELEHLKLNASGIRRFKTTGGEPMLLPGFKDWLRFLVESDYAKNIHFVVVTNGTVSSIPILPLMGQFENFRMVLSIDAVDELTEYIRYPVKFPKLMNNHINIHNAITSNEQYINTISLEISTVMHVLNVHKILDIFKYAEEQLPHIKSNGIEVALATTPSGMEPGLIDADTFAQFKLSVEQYNGKFIDTVNDVYAMLESQYNSIHNDIESHQLKLIQLKEMTMYWKRTRGLDVNNYVTTYVDTMTQLS